MKAGAAFVFTLLVASGLLSAAPPAKKNHESSRLMAVVRANAGEGDRVSCWILSPSTLAGTHFYISGVPADYRPNEEPEKWHVSLPSEVVIGLKDLRAYYRRVKRQVDAGTDPLKISDGGRVPSAELGRVSIRRIPEEKKPNQALQTTPMTRSVYEKTIEFGRRRRGV